MAEGEKIIGIDPESVEKPDDIEQGNVQNTEHDGGAAIDLSL